MGAAEAPDRARCEWLKRFEACFDGLGEFDRISQRTRAGQQIDEGAVGVATEEPNSCQDSVSCPRLQNPLTIVIGNPSWKRTSVAKALGKIGIGASAEFHAKLGLYRSSDFRRIEGTTQLWVKFSKGDLRETREKRIVDFITVAHLPLVFCRHPASTAGSAHPRDVWGGLGTFRE